MTRKRFWIAVVVMYTGLAGFLIYQLTNFVNHVSARERAEAFLGKGAVCSDGVHDRVSCIDNGVGKTCVVHDERVACVVGLPAEAGDEKAR